MNKYIKGKKIKSMEELLDIVEKKQCVYMSFDRVLNYAWVKQQKLSYLLDQIEKGNMYYAVLIVLGSVDGGLFPTNKAEMNTTFLEVHLKQPVGIKFSELPNLNKVKIIAYKESSQKWVDSIVHQCVKKGIDVEYVKEGYSNNEGTN